MDATLQVCIAFESNLQPQSLGEFPCSQPRQALATKGPTGWIHSMGAAGVSPMNRLELLSAQDLSRTLDRLASQVLESVADTRRLLLLGIPTATVSVESGTRAAYAADIVALSVVIRRRTALVGA